MTVQIYVGTYAKYNAGSIAGAWLDCEAYSDETDFLAACAELHRGESDPEFMFQDYEGFPRAFYSESSIDPRIWEFVALDDDDRELWTAYLDNVDDAADFETARDNFAGTADTESDFAAQWLEDTGSLSEVPDSLRNYIDFEAYARDMRLSGDFCFIRANGETRVFYNR